MRKYVYENATVYITEPTEAQLENIRKSTERFVKQLMAKGMIGDDYGRKSNRRTRVASSNARQRDSKTKEKDRTN